MSANWIAADWGTSNLRVWGVDASGGVHWQATSECGMGGLERDEFEPALLALIADRLPAGRVTPVIICGMAGSRQGWAEAPYATTPCAPPNLNLATHAPVTDPRISVHILPGIRQMDPADVMRGEETQIAGLLAEDSDFDGVLCLPGTHTKWVRISAGEVVGFRTFMTGEIFSLLADHSVLRHSVATPEWDDAAFDTAVTDAMARPENLGSDLFTLRASGLLHGTAPAPARARLSGLLIGAELQGARGYWLGQRVALIGSTALSALYAKALAAQGLPAEIHDAETMTLRGLCAAYTANGESHVA